MADLRRTEGNRTFANNPHELARVIECYRLSDLASCYWESAKARKGSSALLGFMRIDYPNVDEPEWHKFLPVSRTENGVRVREAPCDYYLREPYLTTLHDNYVRYAELD